jgi:hypothetical protein
LQYKHILGEFPRLAAASKPIVLIKIIIPLHALANNSNEAKLSFIKTTKSHEANSNDSNPLLTNASISFPLQ